MKISYRLTRWDIFSASFQQLFHQPFLIAFFAILFALTSYTNWRAISPERTFLVRLLSVITLEIIPFMFIAAVVGLFIFLNTFSRKNKTLLTEQTITLDEGFLACQSEYARSEVNWKAVQHIVRTRNYLFLYLSQMGAMLIPKHAFNSKEQWDSFFEFCAAKSRAG